jgi:hypothetical protein
MQVVRQLVSLQTKLRAAVASKRATTTTTAPQPLGADDLRRVSGGTESSPVKGW